jgi:molecular chaperone GrpE
MENEDKLLNEDEPKELLASDENAVEEKAEQTADENNRLEELSSLKEYVQALEDKILRISAETENIRKRYEKIAQEAKDYANTNFAKDLLGVIDNLKRALEHKPEHQDELVKNIISGVEMTKNEFESVLKKNGLQAIEPATGEKFDYNLHHAISQIVTDEYNEDSIVEVMQVGYKIKDRLLRPAIVKVSKKSD